MNQNHNTEGIRTWQEAWDLALDHKGMLYQLLYAYVRKHSLPFYKGEDLQKELESYAWEGFFEACRKWDESKGYTLSTYAYPAVTNAMNARMKVLERMGTSMQGHYQKGTGPLQQAESQRPKLSSLEGLDEMFATQRNLDEGADRSLADIYRQPWQEQEPNHADVVVDAITQAETVGRIREIVSNMSEPHRKVFTLMFLTDPTHEREIKRGLGTGYTLSEVAKEFGRSTTWAREVLDEALEYIRYQLRADAGGQGSME